MNTPKTLLAAVVLSSTLVAAAADNDILYLPGGKTLVIPAFRVYIATGYTPSEKNTEFLRGLKDKVASPRLLTFDATKNNENMLLCRASFPVYGPNKTPFASLMEAAVNMELVASGLVPADAARIPASLDEFDFSSFGGGTWSVGATVRADGQLPLTVKSAHKYSVSATAVNGCKDVMNALPAGIEAFLLQLYSDPRFPELMR